MQRNIKLLGLFNFFTDFKFHSAVLVLYFVKITGSYTLAMSLFSAVMVSSALFEVPTGIFSDFIGRKKTIMLGALAATISAIFYAAGTTYALLLFGTLFEGFSRSWYSGNNDALLYDSLNQSGKKDTFTHYLGRISAMFQIALMLGAIVGSILAQWSFSLIMWLSIIPQALCFCISFFLIEPKKISKGKSNIFSHLQISLHHIWNNKRLRLLNIQDVLRYGMGESSFQFNAAFISTLWPVWAIGFSRVISYGGASLGYWFSGKFIKKLGGYNVLIINNFYTRIINLIAYGYATVFSPILMGTTSFFYGVAEVSNTSLLQKEFSDEQRATLSSVNSLFGSLFYGIFSPFLGYVADIYGPAKAMIMVQCLMFFVLYIQFKLKTMSKYTNTL